MTDMTEAPAADQPTGLRERKKARTRAAIRQHALRLFRERGYSATTVEQIAAAAEVSPATFFRYFPTKEDVVLQDDMDTVTLGALEAQPAALGPIAAMRSATAAMIAQLSQADLDRLRETIELTLLGARDPGPGRGRVHPHHRGDGGRAGETGRARPG